MYRQTHIKDILLLVLGLESGIVGIELAGILELLEVLVLYLLYTSTWHIK